jgi:glycine betaine catabolism B
MPFTPTPLTLQLQFVHRRREAENVESFYFQPSREIPFAAGQYVLCTLRHADVDERGSERAFTIASAPVERLLRVTTRITQPSSSFKHALMHLVPGDTLEASGPYGNFVLQDDDRHTVLIAGGIGITPFRSMLGDLARTGARRMITLLYSNSTTEIAFRPFLDDLSRHWPELRVVYTVTRANSNWDGPTRRIDADFIRQHVPDAQAARFYVCGPTPMVAAIRSGLAEAGVDSSHVVDEAFPGYDIPEPSPLALV